jgi:hypothetical protein
MGQSKIEPNLISIEGFSLDEAQVLVAILAAFTHGNFHKAADVLRDSNTLEGILELFVAEIDELLEVIETEPTNRTNLVAELGDLFHFWNDLFELSEASVASLLISLGIDVSVDELTVAEMKEAAVVDQAQQFKVEAEQLKAKDFLYNLKALLFLRNPGFTNENLIGIIASHIFAAAAALDINVIYAVLMKNSRNKKKYSPVKMNALYMQGAGLSYDEIRARMAGDWRNGMGGDPQFFEEFFVDFPMELSEPRVSQLATEEI